MANTRPRVTAAENKNDRTSNRLKAPWQRIKACGYNIIVPFKFVDGVTLATLVLGYIAWNTDRTLHETLVAANRAWIAPISATLLGQPTIDVPLTYTVTYGNVGKEPGLGFVAQEDHGVIDTPPPLKTLYSVFPKSLLKDVCGRTHASDDGLPQYPSGPRDFAYRISTDEVRFTQEILSGVKAIYVNGCFAYKTFGKERKSQYCFIFLPSRLTGSNDTYLATRCPYGNSAN